jgi:RDD family
VIDFFATMSLPTVVLPVSLQIWGMVVLIGANSVFMQARTGQSLGKVLLGLQVIWPVRNDDHVPMGAYPSMLRCTARICLQFIDVVSVIGLFRPIWDWHRQTFSDEFTKVLVLAQRPLLTMGTAPKGAESLL